MIQMDSDQSILCSQLSKKFGSIFSFQMGTTKMVVLCGADAIYDALINNADIFSDRPHTSLFPEAIKGHGKRFTFIYKSYY